MGASDSKAAAAALDDVENEIQAAPSAGMKLYKYVTTGNGSGNWELVTSNASPKFYDMLEDTSQAGSKHDWFLEIDGSDVEVRIDNAAGIILDPTNKRLTFNAGRTVYAMKVASEQLFRTFTTELNNRLFYNTFQYENDEAGRAKGLGQDFADRLFNLDQGGGGASEPMDVDDGGEVYHTPEKYNERNAFQEDEEEDAILGVIMGATDNSYLMKGNGKFDVLRNVVGGVEDKAISFSLTPSQGSTFKGSSKTPGGLFTPSRVLLTAGERRMHLLDGDNPNSLHHADVETGKIVNTFSFSKDNVEIPIKEIAHDNKSAQLDDTSTFLGLDNNRLCRWDMRVGAQVQQSPLVTYQDGKDYSRGTNFNCMATSGDGFVVVGAQDGQIRLYSSKSLTRANTSVPGMGAPITSVDVTYDGKWIVATTDHYLMVVKTTFTSDKGQVSNGFTSRMGSKGSMPRLLRLKPEDVARTGKGKFKAAKFSWVTEQGQAERYIVASCGKFSVIWNLSKIKSSTSEMISFGGFPTNMDYVMTAKEEEVVDAAFQHRKYAPEDSAIVVATQHSLFNIGGVN